MLIDVAGFLAKDILGDSFILYLSHPSESEFQKVKLVFPVDYEVFTTWSYALCPRLKRTNLAIHFSKFLILLIILPILFGLVEFTWDLVLKRYFLEF